MISVHANLNSNYERYHALRDLLALLHEALGDLVEELAAGHVGARAHRPAAREDVQLHDHHLEKHEKAQQSRNRIRDQFHCVFQSVLRR